MKEIDDQLVSKLLEFDGMMVERTVNPEATIQYQKWLDEFSKHSQHSVSSNKKSCLYEFQAVLHEASGHKTKASEFIEDTMQVIRDNGGHLVSKTAIRIKSELPDTYEPNYEHEENLGLFKNHKLSYAAAICIETIIVLSGFGIFFLVKNALWGILFGLVFTLAGVWVYEIISQKQHNPEIIPKWKNLFIDIAAILAIILFLSATIVSIS